jgi:hypothetical protein
MLKKCTGTKQNASHKLSIANSTGLDWKCFIFNWGNK